MKSSSRARRLAVAAVLATAGLMAAGSSIAAANQYWLDKRPPASMQHCYPGLPYTGMFETLPTAPGTSTQQALQGCSPPLTTDQQITAGTPVTAHLWFTNTGKKACSTFWFLAHNGQPNYAAQNIVGTGSNYGGGDYIWVPANQKTPKEVTVHGTVPSTTLLPAGDQLTLWVDVRTASGSCSAMTLYYGSAGPAPYSPADPSLDVALTTPTS